MLTRSEATECVVRQLDAESCLIAPLGYISREVFRMTSDRRERCFYCQGSMGSVVPLAVGIALARRPLHVLAIEGDGSLLMNLGSLATLRRYGTPRISLFVFDNRCYESSGGQPSQPDDFEIADVCSAAGLPTRIATRTEDVARFFEERTVHDTPAVLVVKTVPEPPAPRIDDDLHRIRSRFEDHVRSF